MKQLREEAKKLGIKSFGKKKEVLALEIEAKKKELNPVMENIEVKIAGIEDEPKIEEVAAEVPKEGTVVIEGETYELDEKGRPIPKINTSTDNPIYRAEATRLKLAIEPKVPFYVPLDADEKPGTIQEVDINGDKFYLPKNEQHMIPVSVFKILQKKLKMRDSTVINSKYKLIDSNKETTEALQ